jgi:hypothetical protein
MKRQAFVMDVFPFSPRNPEVVTGSGTIVSAQKNGESVAVRILPFAWLAASPNRIGLIRVHP